MHSTITQLIKKLLCLLLIGGLSFLAKEQLARADQPASHRADDSPARRLPIGVTDLNGDGRPDLVRFSWNDKQAILIDEAGRYPWPDNPSQFNWQDLLNRAFDVNSTPSTTLGTGPSAWNPLRKGWGSYTILLDLDGDEIFDSAGDVRYSVYDINGDGDPELSYDVCGPNTCMFVALNGERELMDTTYFFGAGAFQRPYPPRAREPGQIGPRYVTNYHGSGFHLSHDPGEAVFGGKSLRERWAKWNPRNIWWESPIAWYDFDGDGWTNMIVRVADGRPGYAVGADGRIQEFELAFELNGNTNRLRQQSLDMQITFTAYHRLGMRFADFEDDLKFLRGRPDADFLFSTFPLLRRETRRSFIPYLDAYKIGTDHQAWESVWLLFDEDDDDCRWEEMFSMHEDASSGGPDLRYFADKLGDRWEMDQDCSGHGKLYISKFDGKIHLFGAEHGEWRIDYYALFKYNYDEPPFGPVPPEGLSYNRVKYKDTDGNGFFDRIEYSKVQFGHEEQSEVIEQVIDLKQFGPDADVCELIDLRVDTPLTGWRFGKWDGQPLSLKQLNASPSGAGYQKIKRLYEKVAEQQWAAAHDLHQAAKSAGLTSSQNEPECAVGPEWSEKTADERLKIRDVTMRAGYGSLSDAQSLREKYHRGYWLREKVFADILRATPQESHDELRRWYYTGQIGALCKKLSK